MLSFPAMPDSHVVAVYPPPARSLDQIQVVWYWQSFFGNLQINAPARSCPKVRQRLSFAFGSLS